MGMLFSSSEQLALISIGRANDIQCVAYWWLSKFSKHFRSSHSTPCCLLRVSGHTANCIYRDIVGYH